MESTKIANSILLTIIFKINYFLLRNIAKNVKVPPSVICNESLRILKIIKSMPLKLFNQMKERPFDELRKIQAYLKNQYEEIEPYLKKDDIEKIINEIFNVMIAEDLHKEILMKICNINFTGTITLDPFSVNYPNTSAENTQSDDEKNFSDKVSRSILQQSIRSGSLIAYGFQSCCSSQTEKEADENKPEDNLSTDDIVCQTDDQTIAMELDNSQEILNENHMDCKTDQTNAMELDQHKDNSQEISPESRKNESENQKNESDIVCEIEDQTNVEMLNTMQLEEHNENSQDILPENQKLENQGNTQQDDHLNTITGETEIPMHVESSESRKIFKRVIPSDVASSNLKTKMKSLPTIIGIVAFAHCGNPLNGVKNFSLCTFEKYVVKETCDSNWISKLQYFVKKMKITHLYVQGRFQAVFLRNHLKIYVSPLPKRKDVTCPNCKTKSCSIFKLKTGFKNFYGFDLSIYCS